MKTHIIFDFSWLRKKMMVFLKSPLYDPEININSSSDVAELD